MNIYTISHNDRTVYALSPQDGALLWQHAFGHKLTGAIAASPTTVFVGAETGNISALSAQDGTLLWQASIPDTVPYPPLRTDGQALYFGSSHGITACSSQNGALLWQFATPDSHDATNAVAAVSEGIVHAFLDGLYALRAGDGSLLWQDTRFRLTPAYMAICNEKVYIPSNVQNNISVLQASDGAPLHTLEGRSIVTNGNILHITQQRKGLYAIDSKDDRIIWTNPDVTLKIAAADRETLYSVASVIKLPSPSSAGTSNPAVPLYVTSVYALHASDGTPKWSWSIPYAGGISSHPLVIEGNIYFSAIGGMYALRGSDGTQLWNTLSDKLLSSDPVAG